MSAPVPAFLALPRSRQYRGGALMGLFLLLDAESQAKPNGIDCWRMLPSGALVSMRREKGGSRVLRIARREAFSTEAGPQLWERELGTFVARFGIEGWTRVDGAPAPGPSAEFFERDPRPRCTACGAPLDRATLGPLVETCPACAAIARGIPAGFQQCDEPGCTNLVEINPTFDVNRCSGCAMRAGRQYAMELGQEQAP